MAILTHDELLRLLRYDPENGTFTRRVVTASRVKIGMIAGYTDVHGYTCLSVLNKGYKAHRLAWFYMTGAWPSGDIDHRDGDRGNNRWNNLRDASRSQNLANSGKRSGNTSGLKGVSILPSGKWRASFSVGNKQRHVGVFDCPAAAHLAYMVETSRHYGEFARAR